MKITNVETHMVQIPLKPERRMKSSLGQHIVSPYLIVRVVTDDGVEGVGEATVMPRWSGETVWSAAALIEHVLAGQVIGRDPTDIRGLAYAMDRAAAHNWFTKAAIEMACWDIAGKAAGQPVYELLGGAVRPLTFRCRFSLGAYEPERARRRATELVEEGFQTIKVKVGGDPDADIERVSIVREVAGPGRDIVIDANCGWDAQTAIEACDRMRDLNVGVFEQPTPDGDYAAMAQVRRGIEPEVMADDICFNMIHARELIRNECCDVISLYPGKQGGIQKCVDIINFAEQNGVACSIGSNLEWDIATAAMGHVIVACKNMQVEKYPGDVLGPDYHEVRIAKNPIEINGPLVTITDRPGLGIDVDWDVVDQHRM